MASRHDGHEPEIYLILAQHEGVRYLWRGVRAGLSWEESSRHEARNDEWNLTLN